MSLFSCHISLINLIRGFLSNNIGVAVSIIKSVINGFCVKSIFIVNNDIKIISGIFLIAQSNIILI